jgi:glucose 1-dehydrogenase
MDRAELAQLRCVVTGASSGIGYAIARAFGTAGAAVLVHYHAHEEEAGQLVDELRAQGRVAHAVQAQLGDPQECERLMQSAGQLLGGIDVLVANAGIQRDAAFTELPLEHWREVLDLNLTGQFLCAQHAVRAFRRQGADPQRSCALGKIIFINSVHQRIPWAGHANYAAAKGGLKMLMETMAQELAVEKIRVNAIAPGAIRTAINEPAWSTPQALDRLLKLIPYGRIGEPEDVARAAVWLASDASDYVVGTTLFVDGAMSLYPAFREGG